MNHVPRMVAISDLRNRYTEVFKMLTDGPLVIANRNQPAAVVIDPDQWNSIVDELDDLRDAVVALRELLAVERGEVVLEDVSPDDIREWLSADAVAT